MYKKLKRKRAEDSGVECTQEEPRFNDLLSSTCIIRLAPTERRVLVPNCAYEHILTSLSVHRISRVHIYSNMCWKTSFTNYSSGIVARCLPCKMAKLFLFFTRAIYFFFTIFISIENHWNNFSIFFLI